MITEGEEKGNFLCSYEDFLTIADEYVVTATGVYGANYKAAVIDNPTVYLPGKPANNTSGYVETTLRSGSYNYRFDRGRPSGFRRRRWASPSPTTSPLPTSSWVPVL